MNNRQESKLKRDQVVFNVFSNYANDVASVAALSKAVARFGELNKAREVEHGKQKVDCKGITTGKNQLKDEVAQMGLMLAGALYSLGDDTSNADLCERMDLVITDFKRVSLADFNRLCENIISLVQKYGSQLTDHGIDQASIDGFVALYNEYKGQSVKPKEMQIGKSTATITLDEMFTESDKLFESKFDKLMVQFKTKNLQFYHDYINACFIDDRGSRSSAVVPPQPATEVVFK